MMRVLLCLILVCGVLGGCRRYERVVSQSNILSGVQGAESGTPSRKKKSVSQPAVMAVPEGGIRQEGEHGEITLYTKSFMHLMTHLAYALQHDEKDLFVEQILSSMTKEEFDERGLDPGLAFEELKEREREVFRLFHFMPMGEYTPGMAVESVGRKTFRLAINGRMHSELRWIGIDAVFEDGNYRLRWLVNNG